MASSSQSTDVPHGPITSAPVEDSDEYFLKMVQDECRNGCFRPMWKRENITEKMPRTLWRNICDLQNHCMYHIDRWNRDKPLGRHSVRALEKLFQTVGTEFHRRGLHIEKESGHAIVGLLNFDQLMHQLHYTVGNYEDFTGMEKQYMGTFLTNKEHVAKLARILVKMRCMGGEIGWSYESSAASTQAR